MVKYELVKIGEKYGIRKKVLFFSCFLSLQNSDITWNDNRRINEYCLSSDYNKVKKQFDNLFIDNNIEILESSKN